MNEVCVVIHEIYSYEDHDFVTEVETFDSQKSAMNYYLMKKEILETEYLDYLDIETLDELENNDYFYMYEVNKENYFTFYINYEEYGFDKLIMESKTVMAFN